MAYQGHIVFPRDCVDSVYIMGSERVIDNTYPYYNFPVKNYPTCSLMVSSSPRRRISDPTLLQRFVYSSRLLLTLGVKSYSDPIIPLPLGLDGWCHFWEGSWSPQYCTLRDYGPESPQSRAEENECMCSPLLVFLCSAQFPYTV